MNVNEFDSGTLHLESMAHYRLVRSHQGIANRLLNAAANDASHGGKLDRRERVGGDLSYYHRRSA